MTTAEFDGPFSSATVGGDCTSSREIRFVEEDDGRWSAVDVETDVLTPGETRRQALELLQEGASLKRHDVDSAAVTDLPDRPECI